MSSTQMVVVHRSRRNIELLLLVFALGIGFAAYVVTSLNLYGELPENWPVKAGLWLGLGIACHAAIRWRIPYADPVLLPCVFLLNGIGLALIFRLDQAATPPSNDVVTQFGWTGLGVVGFIAFMIIFGDHRPLQRFTYTLGLTGLVLLLLPLMPGIGREINGSQIWVGIGPFSFQPAEIAKIVLTTAFASYLVERREVLALAGRRVLGIDLPRARDLGPILIVWAASLLVLLAQRDLGTSMLFFGMFVMMLYVATERPGWPLLGVAMAIIGGLVMFLLITVAKVGFFNHVLVRLSSWLDPFSDYDRNFQIIQGQFGMAWGGLLGRGLGEGRPGLTPLPKSDFIATVVGEELGVAGLMAVVLLYGIIVARGLRTALIGKEAFGKLLAAGLSFTFALQVFTIIGGVTRLLPLTGLTTPFMSQGGSSLVSNWVLVSILMVISHQFRKPVATAVEVDPDAEATQLIPTTNESRGLFGRRRRRQEAGA
ncbi:FtsW/RodA/SpoVE family cell cycle protein [Propionibacteriaceae bacterium Y1700]|uniref:FtsW/RodA/SpoVE family cell cycle protein n=1 Tax=Microlunatus sp. Y1700 TaxID=3418487 RepID=UPI003DA75D00